MEKQVKTNTLIAELMIDDSALGCPLRYDLQVSERPFVDWETVELYLENMGCFN